MPVVEIVTGCKIEVASANEPSPHPRRWRERSQSSARIPFCIALGPLIPVIARRNAPDHCGPGILTLRSPGPAPLRKARGMGLLRRRLEVDLVENQHGVLGSRNEVERPDAVFGLGSNGQRESPGLGDEA